MPTISRYMTRQPRTIGEDVPMSAAHRLMRDHHIRHLPVVAAGKVVGIVSERDLHLIETLPGSDPDEVTVDKAMTRDVYTVTIDTAVDEVVDYMAERKLGSAVVLDRRGNIAGIFTTIDALQFFGDVLRRVTC